MLPSDINFDKSRGNIDIVSAGDFRSSTRPTTVSSYNKEIDNCGVTTYKAYSDSITIMCSEDCQPKLEMTASISLLSRTNNNCLSEQELDDILIYLKDRILDSFGSTPGNGGGNGGAA